MEEERKEEAKDGKWRASRREERCGMVRKER